MTTVVEYRPAIPMNGNGEARVDASTADNTPVPHSELLRPADPLPNSHLSNVIHQIMSGCVDQLPMAHACIAGTLAERAARSAMSTPDVFLIRGQHHPRRKQIVADVILQAVRQGGRVLAIGEMDESWRALLAGDGAVCIEQPAATAGPPQWVIQAAKPDGVDGRSAAPAQADGARWWRWAFWRGLWKSPTRQTVKHADPGKQPVIPKTTHGLDYIAMLDADRIDVALFRERSEPFQRCLLVGEMQGDPSGLFSRLWRVLHRPPAALDYAWVQDGNKIRCRLRSMPKCSRQSVEVERVADNPEIELRIQSGACPQLMEVVFPVTYGIEHAKRFIFRELGECAVQATNAQVEWNETPDRIVARLSPFADGQLQRLEIEPGVHECFCASAGAAAAQEPAMNWITIQIEFDRGLGWSRQRALLWLHRHCGIGDWGRTLDLASG